jgi:hypothetical protein
VVINTTKQKFGRRIQMLNRKIHSKSTIEQIQRGIRNQIEKNMVSTTLQASKQLEPSLNWKNSTTSFEERWANLTANTVTKAPTNNLLQNKQVKSPFELDGSIRSPRRKQKLQTWRHQWPRAVEVQPQHTYQIWVRMDYEKPTTRKGVRKVQRW